jgi:hypothetical protein
LIAQHKLMSFGSLSIASWIIQKLFRSWSWHGIASLIYVIPYYEPSFISKSLPGAIGGNWSLVRTKQTDYLSTRNWNLIHIAQGLERMIVERKADAVCSNQVQIYCSSILWWSIACDSSFRMISFDHAE